MKCVKFAAEADSDHEIKRKRKAFRLITYDSTNECTKRSKCVNVLVTCLLTDLRTYLLSVVGFFSNTFTVTQPNIGLELFLAILAYVEIAVRHSDGQAHRRVSVR